MLRVAGTPSLAASLVACIRGGAALNASFLASSAPQSAVLASTQAAATHASCLSKSASASYYPSLCAPATALATVPRSIFTAQVLGSSLTSQVRFYTHSANNPPIRASAPKDALEGYPVRRTVPVQEASPSDSKLRLAVNDSIPAKKLEVEFPDGRREKLKLHDAIVAAKKLQMDLVSVAGTGSNPRFARIMKRLPHSASTQANSKNVATEAPASSRILRQLEKDELKTQRELRKRNEAKEVHVGSRIQRHDFNIKLAKVQHFLQEGRRVSVRLEMRDRSDGSLAAELQARFVQGLKQWGHLEHSRSSSSSLELTFSPKPLQATASPAKPHQQHGAPTKQQQKAQQPKLQDLHAAAIRRQQQPRPHAVAA